MALTDTQKQRIIGSNRDRYKLQEMRKKLQRITAELGERGMEIPGRDAIDKALSKDL